MKKIVYFVAMLVAIGSCSKSNEPVITYHNVNVKYSVNSNMVTKAAETVEFYNTFVVIRQSDGDIVLPMEAYSGYIISPKSETEE